MDRMQGNGCALVLCASGRRHVREQYCLSVLSLSLTNSYIQIDSDASPERRGRSRIRHGSRPLCANVYSQGYHIRSDVGASPPDIDTEANDAGQSQCSIAEEKSISMFEKKKKSCKARKFP